MDLQKNNTVCMEEIQYSLSPLQQGMLFHHLQAPDHDPYITQNILCLEGKLDMECCMESYQMLIQKHQNLRTVFFMEKGGYFQKIVPYQPQEVELYDFTGFSEDKKQEKLSEIMEEDLKRSFHLFEEIPIRLKIIKQSECTHQLIWTTHHIIIDGWCIGILLSDMLEFYHRLVNKKEVELEAGSDYFQYIKWLKEQDTGEGIRYWKERLSGYESVSDLSSGVKRQKDNMKFQQYQFTFPDELRDKLTAISREYCISMNHIYESIWGIVLQKLLNTNDVAFGKVVSGRNHDIEDIESMIGLFINTLISRITSHNSDTYITLALRVQDDYFDSYEHDYITLSDIHQAVGREHMISHIFVCENFLEDERFQELQNKNGLSAKMEKYHDITNYDLAVVVDDKQELCWSFEYNSSVYRDEFFEKIETYIRHVTKQICGNPNCLVVDISLADEKEKNRLLYKFNREYDDSCYHQTAIGLLNETFAEKRNRIALVCGQKTMTYELLDEKSRKFSLYLQSLHIQRETPVAVRMDKSIDFIITVLGIVRAGLIYLPISRKYPEERVGYILEDSKSALFITDDFHCQKELSRITEVKHFQDIDFFPFDASLYQWEPGAAVSSQNVAYIIYTSGTTGKPKGVALTHRGLVNLNQVCIKQFGVTASDVVALFADISFDASVSELFMALFNGACLDIPGEEIIWNPDLFGTYLVEHQISVVTLPPVYLSLLNPKLEYCLKTLITAGSAANPEMAALWGEKYHYINAYGPTEDTVCSTCWSVKVEELTAGEVPIGKPVNNLI